MTRLILVSDEHPGGVEVRCDRCVLWTLAIERASIHECLKLGCQTHESFGCPMFKPRSATSVPTR